MSFNHLLAEVVRRSGVPEPTAETALRAFVVALAPGAGGPTRNAVSRELPPPLDALFRKPSSAAPAVRDAVINTVAAAAHLEGAAAFELYGVVASEIAGLLEPETRARLTADLEPDLGRDLVPPSEASALPVAHHEQPLGPRGHTLATGSPGSDHPLSTSRADLAHEHSVGRAVAPHQLTKLSGTTGISSERYGRTLAGGEPGSDEPVSESHGKE